MKTIIYLDFFCLEKHCVVDRFLSSKLIMVNCKKKNKTKKKKEKNQVVMFGEKRKATVKFYLFNLFVCHTKEVTIQYTM